MLKKIKKLLRIPDKFDDLSRAVKGIEKMLYEMKDQKEIDMGVELMRKTLQGIDVKFTDPDSDMPISPGDRRNFVATIAGSHYAYKKLIDYIIQQRITWIAKNSENWHQVSFGRGGLNELIALSETLEKFTQEHRQYTTESKGGGATGVSSSALLEAKKALSTVEPEN